MNNKTNKFKDELTSEQEDLINETSIDEDLILEEEMHKSLEGGGK